MKNKYYLHPILYSILPVLVLYSHNIRESWPSLMMRPIFFCLLLLFVSWIFFFVIFRDKHKSSIISSVWLILFFSYGHSFLYLANSGFFELLPIGPHLFLIGFYLGILSFVYLVLYVSKKSVQPFTAFFNIASVTLLALNLIPLLPFEFNRLLALQKLQVYTDTMYEKDYSAFSQTDVQQYPDIYYFVFDRFPNHTIAHEYFEYDTTPFLSELESKNFYVATQSAANYPSTYQSLSSSLSSTHLTFLEEMVGSEYADQTILYKALIENNQTVQFLKDNGYKVYHLGSNWEPTKQSNVADENLNLYLGFNEFESFIYENTIWNALVGKLTNKSLFTGVEILEIRQKNIPYQRDQISRIAQSDKDQPKFVFNHYLLPHPPYLFDANCDALSFEEVRKREDILAYTDQITCAEKLMLEYADVIISNSKRPVVIVFQSDEGPYLPHEYFNDTAYVQTENNDAYKIHSRILNAYYFSDVTGSENQKGEYQQTGLSQNISPVNTFNIIFNRYFGTQIELVPNETYVFSNENTPYNFTDITHLVWE